MSSCVEWICGGDRIGTKVDDLSSPWHGQYPIAPVMCAQLEIIIFTKLLRPFTKVVLEGLQALLTNKDRTKRSWLTVYLTLFILLHSCSMTTARDEEWARETLMPVGCSGLRAGSVGYC